MLILDFFHPQRRKIIFFTLFLWMTAGCLTALAGESDFTLAKKLDPEYDQVYPYYVEVCAVSRIRPLDGPEGGGWGHALMYMKGACLDREAPYPKIRMCETGEADIHSPEAGVGISVDKMFKTVNWIGVPGKQLFYHGNLEKGSRLTREHFETTISEAMNQDLFKGIKFYKAYMASKPPEQSSEAWVARQTMGTDYALKFARTSLCARLPVTKDMIQQMADYLNRRNEEIFLGKAKFQWSAYYDNCAHTVHNALAAAGIWEEKSINQFRVKQFFNRAIPANEFADFAFLIKDHPGALLKIIPAHEPNDLFGTDYKLFVLEGPFRKPVTGKVRKMFEEPRHTDLRSNLLDWESHYAKSLKITRGPIWHFFHHQDAENEDRAYRKRVEKELGDIRAKLRKLAL